MCSVGDELNSQLAEFDFCNIAYRVYPCAGLSGCNTMVKKAHTQLEKYPLFTSPLYHREFISQFLALQRTKQVSLKSFMFSGGWPSDFVRAAYQDETTAFLKAKIELFSEHNIKGETSLFVHRPEDRFVGHFMIHSELTNEELEKMLSQRFAKKMLEMTHFFLSRNFPSLINPYINNGKIKKRTLSVLEQISLGANRKEAADSLYMTSRGVDYHLEQFRVEFNARNNSELVRLAKESCLF